MEELIKKLIELVENASPKLWEIAMRQVIVTNISNIVLLLALVVYVYLCIKFTPKFAVWASDTDFDDISKQLFGWMGLIIGWIIAITGFIVTLTSMTNILTGFVNPEYAAIYNLLQLVK